MTNLQQLCKNNDLEKIKLLTLDKMKRVVPYNYIKAMQIAYNLKHIEIYKHILLFLLHNNKIYNGESSKISKLIILATLDNDYLKANQLMDANSCINYKEIILYATRYNNSELLKLVLLKFDFNDNINDYHLALIYAIRYNNITIFKILISFVKNIHPFVTIAFEKKKLDIFTLLVSDPRFDYTKQLESSYQPGSFLGMAVLNNNLEVVEKMVMYNYVDPAAKNNEAIIFAAQNNYIDIYKLLIRYPSVDPSSCNNWAIRLAVANNKVEMVNLLLQDPRVDPSAKSNVNIYKAAAKNYIEIVKRLLQDPRVDPSGFNNRTIIKAFNNGNFEIVRLLMQDNRIKLDNFHLNKSREILFSMRMDLADPLKTNTELKNIYKLTESNIHKKILLNGGFPILPKNIKPKTIFKEMKKYKINTNNIPHLLKIYANNLLADVFVLNQNTIIITHKYMYAINIMLKVCSLINHVVLMEYVIRYSKCTHGTIGINCPICKDSDLAKLLPYCIDNGYINACYYIIKNYASADYNDNYCIKVAAETNQYEMTKFLLTNGADVHAENGVALIKACSNGNIAIVNLLIKFGADINKINNGYYPLEYAVMKGKIDMTKYLIENGADFSIKDNNAIKLSIEYNHLDILKYLVEKKAKYHNGNNYDFIKSDTDFIKSNTDFSIIKYLLKL